MVYPDNLRCNIMPVVVNNQTYYRTAEVCRMVGISRNTLFRWLKEGIFSVIEYRDWRGWRLFTGKDVHQLKARVNHIERRATVR